MPDQKPLARANWLDRAIETFAPGWAVERAAARFTLQAARSYDAAKTGRRADGWITSGKSANAEIGAGASRIRARTRDLVRNNPYAATAVRKLADKIVGTGIIPRLSAPRDEQERKRAAQDAWTAFSDNCDPAGQLDFYGIEKLTARALQESGEALIRFQPRPSSWRLRVPLQLQVLEPDYLDSAKTQRLNDGSVVIQGVQFDQWGRRAGYWMFDDHPGDSLPASLGGRLQSRFVPASDVLHIFDVLRAGQARGVSAFTSVVFKLRDVDEVEDAKLTQQKIAACFAAFVKKSAGGGATPLGAAKTDEKGRRIERLSPAMIQYLGQDEDVTFGNPPSVDGFSEFMAFQLHAVAAGTGCTYEQLTGDLRGVNFSSIRAGMIDFWDLVDHWQWMVLVPQLCKPVWSRFGQVLAAQGRRDLARGFDAKWTPPYRRYVDPEKEVRAKMSEMRGGLTSYQRAVAETGEDADEVLAEIAAHNKLLDELGVVLDSDPRKTSNAGLTQARPQGSVIPGDEPADKETKDE